MAGLTQAMVTSFKVQLLTGSHNFTLDVFVGAPGNSVFSATGMVPDAQNDLVLAQCMLNSVTVVIT